MIVDLLHEELASLAQQGLQRSHRVVASPSAPLLNVDGHAVIAFCSNDYLGLANNPEVIAALAQGANEWGAGAGASHLICGHQKPHEDLQIALARFVGMDKALLFSTGYMANMGIISALVGRGDAVFADRLNHASLLDAVQLSRAEHMRYPHGDLGILKGQLAATTCKRKMILTDAVFSMDGDLAPLPELFELAEKHDAWLVIDDAHGFGTLGPQGQGSLTHYKLSAHPRIIYMGTLGKAAGVSGAFVAGNATVIDYLLQTSRTHIFTTASAPALAVALQKSLQLIEQADQQRAHLNALITRLRSGLTSLPWELMTQEGTQTPIQPIIVGSNEAALRLTEGLLKQGFWVPAIRPPTVPAGKARLRITLSAKHSETQVDALLSALRSLA